MADSDDFAASLRSYLSYAAGDERAELLTTLLEEGEELLEAPLDVVSSARWLCDLVTLGRMGEGLGGPDVLSGEALEVGSRVADRLRSAPATLALASALGGGRSSSWSLLFALGWFERGRPEAASLALAGGPDLLRLALHLWGVPSSEVPGALAGFGSVLVVPSDAVSRLVALFASQGSPCHSFALGSLLSPVVLETFAGLWDPVGTGPLSDVGPALDATRIVLS